MNSQTRKEPKGPYLLDLILEESVLGIAPVGDFAGQPDKRTRIGKSQAHSFPLTGHREALATSRSRLGEEKQASFLTNVASVMLVWSR